MDKFQNIIKSYDLLKDEDGRINIEKMTDEQIDELVDLQNEMISETLPSLVAFAKMQTARRLKAEKEEEFAKVLIRRLMQRVDLQDFDCVDGKIKMTKGTKYDIDLTKLSPELLAPNHASIRAKINKWENIDWVIPTMHYFTASIK